MNSTLTKWQSRLCHQSYQLFVPAHLTKFTVSANCRNREKIWSSIFIWSVNCNQITWQSRFYLQNRFVMLTHLTRFEVTNNSRTWDAKSGPHFCIWSVSYNQTRWESQWRQLYNPFVMSTRLTNSEVNSNSRTLKTKSSQYFVPGR